MLDTASPLKRTQLGSRLASQSKIRPQGGVHRRSGLTGLMLTSLVDAFSILVIFLIMSHSANQDVVNLGKNLTLPSAADSQFIQSGTQVRIEENSYFIEDKPVSLAQLAAELKSVHEKSEGPKKEGLVIVADKSLDYESLSPVILAGSHAGFTKFKFAVVQKD